MPPIPQSTLQSPQTYIPQQPTTDISNGNPTYEALSNVLNNPKATSFDRVMVSMGISSTVVYGTSSLIAIFLLLRMDRWNKAKEKAREQRHAALTGKRRGGGGYDPGRREARRKRMQSVSDDVEMQYRGGDVRGTGSLKIERRDFAQRQDEDGLGVHFVDVDLTDKP
ncbi:MAG: hypothetical protein Q9166_003259 [cf. Caloplaca sp. 2 TL-2023]